MNTNALIKYVSLFALITSAGAVFAMGGQPLEQERAERIAADEALQAAIDQEVADRTAGDLALQAADAQEVADRMAADQGLQSAIDQERSERIAGDAALQTAIDQEAAARMTGDQSLQDTINFEVARGEAAIQNLIDADAATQATIDFEVARGEAAIQALLDADVDIRATIDFEVARGEAAIQNLIDADAAEASARAAADTSIEAMIAAQTDALNTAVMNLEAADAAEASTRAGADDAINAEIDSEVIRAENAIGNLIAADDQLEMDIAAETAAREAAVLDLQNADTALSNRIDNLNSLPDGSGAGDLLEWDAGSGNWVARTSPTALSNNPNSGDNLQPYVAVNYIIALTGVYPSRSSIYDPTIGEVMLFAGNFAPRGWAFCDGQLLPINQYQALFSILGTTYGGDGRTTFALPDLRGRVAVGPRRGPGLNDYRLGQRGGSETETTHTHVIQ